MEAEMSSDLPRGSSLQFNIRESDSPHLTRSKHRREYHHILSVVDKQTGSPDGPNDQPAMCRTSSVTSIAKQNGVDEPKKRLRAAIENDDLVAWRGECRRVCRARTEDLRAALAKEDALEHPDRAKMRFLAKTLAEVDDD